ncbi:unnamed protein product [Candidula unifasciata]|uniref:G-protein coupled receptors family 1 profile domain-containing protein n=1 Tax=Candidula unifasciata TaxID=100452 RepID=A0A8S4A514_9EUPU|nr:unnamed protein product [Candidula unifasciata]
MEHLRNVLVAIYISCSILIIKANLFIIGAILYSPVLRKKTRNHIIISIALADLLLGSFVTPMLATNLIESSIADCHTHLAVQVIGDHGIFFVVGWELVTFNILHLRESNMRFPWNFLKVPVSACLKSFILTIWPWFAALCILVPLIVTNAPIKLYYNLSDDAMCMMRLPRNILVTVCFFSLYLPFYLCVAALVTVVVCYSKGCHKRSSTTLMDSPRNDAIEEAPQRLEVEQQVDRPDNPLVACVPNMVYLVCYMPLIVHTWLHFSNIYTPNAAYGMIVFGLLARSIILPLSWAVFKDIRHELKEYEKKLKNVLGACVRNPLPSTSSAVSFSRLQETQTV